MAVEYDLVVIGGGSAGFCAAVAATRLKARVALVEQLGETGFLHRQALLEVGLAHRMTARGVYVAGVSGRCDQAMQWAEAMVSTLVEHNPLGVASGASLALLASLGVEVLFGRGQFCNQPLSFEVNGRQLRARAYLIATGVYTAKSTIEGLQSTGYLTCEDFSQLNSIKQSPQELLVIGGGLVSTELSQALHRLGFRTTMVVEGPHILAQEDAEAARLIQAQLEAEGIRILTHSRVTQVKQINGKKRVLVGERAIEADQILLSVGQRPQVEFLNLEAVGVKVAQQGIWVNDKLQTTHPRIYACGDVMGGYPLVHVANYEARIVLKNALFLPIFRANYRAIPWAVFSDPELARVGLTEAQARHSYGGQVQVLRTFYKTLDRAQLRGETTGFCKIIVLKNGTILGAHLVGSAAAEVIHLIALAMRQRLKVSALSDLVHVSPTFSEISFKTATEWELSHTAREDFLESFFNLRRSWF